MMNMRPTVCGTGKEGANFDVETPTFKNFHCKSKVIRRVFGVVCHDDEPI